MSNAYGYIMAAALAALPASSFAETRNEFPTTAAPDGIETLGREKNSIEQTNIHTVFFPPDSVFTVSHFTQTGLVNVTIRKAGEEVEADDAFHAATKALENECVPVGTTYSVDEDFFGGDILRFYVICK